MSSDLDSEDKASSLGYFKVWSPGAKEKKENFVLETCTFLAEFCVESSVLSEFPLGQDSQQRQIYLWNGLNIIIWASLPISIMSLGKIAQVFSFGVMFLSILFNHLVLASVWGFRSVAKNLRQPECQV